MTVSSFITLQPDPQREIMVVLRSWIRDLGPHTQERIRYKIPYFYFYGPIASVHPDENAVVLSFTKGYELDDENKILESKGRKHVKSITFYSVAEVEEHEHEIRKLLNQAAILNEFQHKQKLRKRK